MELNEYQERILKAAKEKYIPKKHVTLYIHKGTYTQFKKSCGSAKYSHIIEQLMLLFIEGENEKE